MLRDDLVYLAGFFDGEGSIGAYTNGSKTVYLKVQLVQNQSVAAERLMKALLAEYGGNLSYTKSGSGKIKMNWQISSKKAVEFLKDIFPWLRLKEAQARLAITWMDRRTPGNPGYDQTIAKELKRLKLPDIPSV